MLSPTPESPILQDSEGACAPYLPGLGTREWWVGAGISSAHRGGTEFLRGGLQICTKVLAVSAKVWGKKCNANFTCKVLGPSGRRKPPPSFLSFKLDVTGGELEVWFTAVFEGSRGRVCRRAGVGNAGQCPQGGGAGRGCFLGSGISSSSWGGLAWFPTPYLVTIVPSLLSQINHNGPLSLHTKKGGIT